MKKVLLLSVMFSAMAFAAMKDGVYKAEVKSFDDKGWKPVLELTVKDGKISAVKSDEVNEKGDFKSKDTAYNERWKSRSNIDFPMASEKAVKDLIAKQDPTKVDDIAGATSYVGKFKKLAEVAMKNASAGKTETAIID